MPANQPATVRLNSEAPRPTTDTYANAILRTLSSFKAPSPATSYFASRQHRRTYPRTTRVSTSVVNEVSGIKACMHTCSYVLSPFSRSYFQVEVDGWSNLPQLPVLLSLSPLCVCACIFLHTPLRRSPYEFATVMSSRWGRNDLTAFSEILYPCRCPYCFVFLFGIRDDDKLILLHRRGTQRLSLSGNTGHLYRRR